MDPIRYQQIKAILADLLERPSHERAGLLAERCGTDADLRAEVESLLKFASGDDFLTPGSADLVGRRLGQFRIASSLREGGMARVYKAYQASVDRFVALKVLPRQCTAAPQFLERFKQEARIVASLHHPHILPVFDHGTDEGYAYLAMPLVESGTLADVLSRGRVSFVDTERIITQVCDALDYAHAKGIVHRDIKPSNILIDSNGHAFVADFGIAKILGATGQLTQTGLYLGSPHYMSPEQMTGGVVGPVSDLYSVGLVLYEMVAGTVPFKAESALASISKHLSEPLPSPKLQNAEITPALEAVVMKALARSKADRFPTGRQLAAALSAAVRAFELQGTRSVQRGAGVPAAASVSDSVETRARTVAGRELSTGSKSPARQARGGSGWSWLAGGAAVLSLAILAVWMLRDRGGYPESQARVAEVVPLASPSIERAAQPVTRAIPRGGPPSSNAGSPTSPGVSVSGQAREAAPSRPTETSPPPSGDVEARRSDAVTAKVLYAAAPAGEPLNPGLRYRIVERRGPNQHGDADPAKTFHSGDRVRFAFESNIDGYLYVVLRGSTGQWTVLFPDPEMNGGRNATRRGEEHLVPNNGWFVFDDTPGVEEVFVILSRQPLDMLPGFDAPVVRREKVDTSVVTTLQGSIRSRDLAFEKEAPAVVGGRTSQATYVVNRAELANRVAAFIPLTHAK